MGVVRAPAGCGESCGPRILLEHHAKVVFGHELMVGKILGSLALDKNDVRP